MEGVNCLLLDRDGYLWIGTQEGLNRFDGYAFRLFLRDENPYGLKDDFIYSLAETSRGDILVGTLLAGVQLYERKTGRFHTIGTPEDQLIRATSFLVERESGIARGSSSIGLFTLDADERRLSITAPWQAQMGHILEDIQEPGKIWAATVKGLYRLDPGGSQLLPEPALGGVVVTHLAWDQTESFLWLGTSTGLKRYHPTTEEVVHFHPENSELQRNVVMRVKPDQHQKDILWLGTNKGLIRFHKTTGQAVTYSHSPSNPNGLGHNLVTELLQDRFQNTWVSTLGKGVDRFRPNPFIHYGGDTDNPNAPRGKTVRLVHQDLTNPDILWVGVPGGGLSRLDRKTERYTHFQHDPEDPTSLANDTVNGMTQDWDNRLWVGTDLGLSLMKGRQFHNYPVQGNIATFLAPDAGRKVIWFGGLNGVGKMDPATETVTWLRAPPEQITVPAFEQVASLIYDPDRDLLFAGAFGGGVRVFHPEKGLIRRYEGMDKKSGEGLPSPMVGGIKLDSQGRLWVCTAKGLASIHLDSHQITHYPRTWGPGLGSVYCAEEDRQGNIWIGTQYGLSMLNPGSGLFRDFTPEDGLQGYEFSAGAASSSPTGELFFGGTNGFNAFYPNEIQWDLSRPRTHLTQLLLFNHPVKTRDWDPQSPLEHPIEHTTDLQLNHHQNMWALEFAAPTFHQARLIRYAYRLDPYDEDWIETGYQYRRAGYTRVPAGTYQFRVKAANRDGIWGDEETLEVIILPPPWWSWWAKTLYVMILMALIYWYVSFQALMRRRLRERVKERTGELVEAQKALVEAAHLTGMAEIAANMLHEVGNRLNSVRTSTGIIRDRAMEQKVSSMLEHVIQLLKEHDRNPKAFFTPERLRNLRSGLVKIHDGLDHAAETVKTESLRLEAHLDEVEKALAHNLALSQANRSPEITSLKNLVENALHMEEQLLREANIKLEIHFRNDPPVSLVKPTFLRVLTCLLDNAREAVIMQDGDRTITISLQLHNQWIALDIEDTGSGVAREDLTQIFAQGFTTKSDGKGFGLHYSANAMTGMNGKLELSSDGPGKGARVRLLFPPVETTGTDL